MKLKQLYLTAQTVYMLKRRAMVEESYCQRNFLCYRFRELKLQEMGAGKAHIFIVIAAT